VGMKRFLNPVGHFSERTLLFISLLGVFLNMVICYLLGYRMASVVNFVDGDFSFGDVIRATLLAYLVGIVALYLLGLLYNKRTRLIDIVNTVVLSTLPGLVILLCANIPLFLEVQNRLVAQPVSINITDSAIMFGFVVLTFPALAYTFILFFNGFKTATHMKKWYQIALFFIVLLSLAAFSPYIL
jgi:hypothetical protein